jgi:ATP-dependent RNA helicase DeaD
MDLPSDARIAQSRYEGSAQLLVWYGVPTSTNAGFGAQNAEEQRDVIALITPSELTRLRAAGVNTHPVALPQALDEAAQRQRALRDELNSLLRRESVDAELATIEPLLADHDAAEVAAATLRLLSRARRRIEASATASVTPAAVATRPAAPAEDAHWTRLFLSVGERDGARRGDLVGAITGEAGITGTQIGKIDMRDSYSLVDIAAPVADKVVERLTGVTIKGRRVTARLDRSIAAGAAPRSGGPEGRRGPPRRDFERAERGERSGGSGPRAARESEEWSARGERLRHSRRPPRGNEP